MALTFGLLFRRKPKKWGLRGDPFLWDEMAARFETADLPASTSSLEGILDETFASLVGERLSTPSEAVFVERYNQGAHVSPAFWRETAVPLLVERFRRIRSIRS